MGTSPQFFGPIPAPTQARYQALLDERLEAATRLHRQQIARPEGGTGDPQHDLANQQRLQLYGLTCKPRLTQLSLSYYTPQQLPVVVGAPVTVEQLTPPRATQQADGTLTSQHLLTEQERQEVHHEYVASLLLFSARFWGDALRVACLVVGTGQAKLVDNAYRRRYDHLYLIEQPTRAAAVSVESDIARFLAEQTSPFRFPTPTKDD